jgi:hypothetical protein
MLRGGRRLSMGLAFAALLIGGPANASPTWTIQPTPNPSPGNSAELHGVSCPSYQVCFAVGSYRQPLAHHTLIEVWHGTTWMIEPSQDAPGFRDSLLFGVSCSSTSSCVAVGDAHQRSGPSHPLGETWNGSAWQITTLREPVGSIAVYLTSVSCPAIDLCLAAGSFTDAAGDTRTLVETWNGKKWKLQRTPNPANDRVSQLYSVSCSSVASCVSVGVSGEQFADTALAEGWNGKRWSLETVPAPKKSALSELIGVSCYATAGCLAVGDYSRKSYAETHPLAEILGHDGWTRQPVPDPDPTGLVYPSLGAVSCRSGADCTAIGSAYDPSLDIAAPIAANWDGSTWTMYEVPRPYGQPYLNDISCPTERSCTAAGENFIDQYYNPDSQTLVETETL